MLLGEKLEYWCSCHREKKQNSAPMMITVRVCPTLAIVLCIVSCIIVSNCAQLLYVSQHKIDLILYLLTCVHVFGHSLCCCCCLALVFTAFSYIPDRHSVRFLLHSHNKCCTILQWSFIRNIIVMRHGSRRKNHISGRFS